jgi:DNA helicase HerA-like ATPase
MAAHDLTERVATFRSVRADLEASVLPLATSVDGRRFSFQSSVQGLALRLGGYVVLADEHGSALGQVRSLGLAEVDAGELGQQSADGTGPEIRTRMSIRLVRGEGVILERGVAPFHDRLARPATPEEVAAWQTAAAPRGATLEIGSLALAGVPTSLAANGFDRHTFLCGQSGSGKSYSLGLMLEQLLLQTDLRIVILDPNSDFVRLGELRDGVEPSLAKRWEALAGGIAVRSADATGRARLRLRFPELGAASQGALLRLDPVEDREEYAELAELVARERPQHVGSLSASDQMQGDRLRLRVENLGVESWGVWARDDPGSVLDEVVDRDVRCLVVDVGSLPTRGEQALVAESVLRRLWVRRGDRRPVLLVVDEAHNVCPAVPEDPITALATEHAVRIAGEGRKFGIYMLVSTQRPQKVHEHVITQCDNLVLMRLNSPADAAFVGDVFGFAPPALVGLAPDFGLGEALVAGKIASHPSIVRFGARVAREGGGDVDAGWAR